MASSPLAALANIVLQGVQTLESSYSRQGTSFPSLDEPKFLPGALDGDSDLAATTRLIVAAAHQIIATVRSPIETMQDCGLAMYMTAALGFVEDVNVADAIKEAGPQGLHVKEIGAKIGVDSVKLARVLRYLATRHIFREVSPDVYANNRISSLLIKPKPLEEIEKDKLTKYDDAGISAFIGHMADESFEGATRLGTFIKEEPEGVNTSWNLTTGRKGTVWDWLQEPDNLWRYRRVNSAMKGGSDRFPATIFTESLDWNALDPGSVVVDVGGNVGKVVQPLAESFTHLKYVIEDLPTVIEDAKKFWTETSPQAVKDGRVVFQDQDFFQPQAIQGASVYLLRFIIHDWSDEHCITILKNLRRVALPTTRLLIFEHVMPHVCTMPGDPSSPPPPLLGNLGMGLGGFLTALDLEMLAILNGRERTEEEFRALGAAAGWKLEVVRPGVLAAFIFSPI
ncbi:S-adenosyl-L-methionine-dependent methyltransferase [Gloeopeniophorella convolvens]|nr:S-adenosyl-L-methionine-dependent methyltransferase [Gloeopeniophorella convolvens]